MRSLPLGHRRSERHRLPALSLVVLVLIGLPIVEVWLLIQVGHWIGVLPTVAILVAEAILGGWLLRREGGRAYAGLTGALADGALPTRELADAALVLVGGVLLMLPGFVTDVLAVVCLLPFTRVAPRHLLGYLVGRRVLGWGARVAHPGQGDVVEGETVDVPPPADRRPPSAVMLGEVDDGRR